MYTSAIKSIFYECDFCKTKGVLGQNISERDGWYFCKSCLDEIEQELEKRRQGELFKKNMN